MARRRRRSPWRRLRRAIREPRNALLARLIRGGSRVVGSLPTPVTLAVGRGLGRAAHRILGTPRRLALEHLGLAFPSMGPTEREAVVRAMFEHAGAGFAELALWPRLRDTEYVRFAPEALRVLDDGLAEGHGVIVVAGHIGNWELLAASVAHRGYPITVVARRVRDERFDALVRDVRSSVGLRILDRDDPRFAHALRAELSENRLVALLIDQDTRGAGVWVPFFGRPARTPAGAAVLAMRARAAVAAAFIERRPAGGHLVRIVPVERGAGRTKRDIVDLTARMTAAIEAQIRRNPAEWVWWHRRWRRPPE